MDNSRNKKIAIIVSIFVVALIVIYFILAVVTNKNFQITQISPNPSEELIAGKKLNITITLDREITLDQISISLTREILGDDKDFLPVGYSSTLSDDKKSINVLMDDPITGTSDYSLTVKDSSQRVLISSLYKSQKIELTPTPAVTNNLLLKQYLPHETSNYGLVYDSTLNLYIFHFKYSIDSTDSSDIQFTKAKSDATTFIQSKGINISSINIVWQRN